MSEDKETEILTVAEHNTGMSGGTSYGGVNVGSNRGSISSNQGDRSVHNLGNIGSVATGDNHSGSMSAVMGSGKQRKDPRDLTSEELLALVRKRGCSEETVEIVGKERVTGSEFMEDDILEQLNITNSTDVRKLKSLQKYLRRK